MEKPKVDLTRVIDKIRKLLALGTSPNEHEAASAVSKAQSLLAEYDLSMESIGDLKADHRTAVTKGQTIVSTTEGKPDGWKADVFEAVAQTSDCFTAYSYEYERTPGGKERRVKRGNLIGFGHDVELAGYALSFLLSEIERLAQAYADTLWSEIRERRDREGLTQHDAESFYTADTGRHPLKAKLYFTKGAAEAVVIKLYEEHRARQRAAEAAAAAGSTSMVVRKREAVADFLSIERYGMTVAECEADWRRKEEALRAERALAKTPELTPKPETPAEARARKLREEAEERRAARRSDAHWRAQERAEAKKDRHAYKAGSEAGARVSIRPGVAAGKETLKIKGGQS